MFGLSSDTIREIHGYLVELPEVDKVLIYGSRAKGNYRIGSDIDLTLIGSNLTLKNSVYRLEERVEESYLPYSFDISIFSQISNADLLDHIARVGKVFYER